jgi:regulator of sigma E protease
MLLTGGASVNDLSGPVGIVKSMGDTYEESVTNDGYFYAFLNMLYWGVLISANLGVMNLLPIPALDGGRLLLLLIEAVRRKRFNPEKEGYVNLVGLGLLMLLMVVVMFNDIRKLFI